MPSGRFSWLELATLAPFILGELMVLGAALYAVVKGLP